jgi:glyoxylase-like metal-dependent hydrolase (beta-lactamase superfamily II)
MSAPGGRARERRPRVELVGRLRGQVTAAAVQAGVRAAVATTAPIAVAYAAGAPALVIAGVGGWLTSMADVGGALGVRMRTMGAYLLVGPLAYAAGTLAAPLPAPAVAALAACWAAAGGLLRAGGESGATLGVLAAATFAAALGAPERGWAAALGGGGLLALGGAWAVLLAAAWPARPYAVARAGAAECYHALAAFARGIGDAAAAGAGAPARPFTALAREAHPRVRAAIEAARTVLVAARRGRAGGSRRADDVAVLLDGAESLFLTLLTAAEAAEVAAGHAGAPGPDGALAADVRRLAGAFGGLGAVLDGVADAVVDAAPGRRPAGAFPPPVQATAAELEREVVTLVEAEDGGAEHGGADAAWEDGDGGAPPRAAALERAAAGRAAAGRAALRHAAALLEHAVGEAERAAETAAALSAEVDRPEPALRARPAGRSLWSALGAAGGDAAAWARAAGAGADRATVRHALRLAAAVAAAQLLGAALHATRGPWITVTALLVLQPSAGLTVRRSAARVAGTVAGGVVAAALAAALHDERLIAGVVFVLAGLAVTARGVNYGVFTFFLTPVFVLLAQPAPGDWALAGVRVADTLLGAAVALAAGLLLWPAWESASLGATVADAVEASRAHLALAVRAAAGAAGGASPAALADARRRAGLAATAGEGALERLLAEPGGRRRGAALLALLARARRLNGAASALAGFGPPPHAPGAARLTALGTDVDAVLADVAAAARAGRPPAAAEALERLLDEPGDGAGGAAAARTAERRVPDVPAWGALVRAARHALGVRAAAGRLFGAGRGGARLLAAAAAAWLGAGCGRAVGPLAVPGRSAVALTGGPNTSMIYVARTGAGLLAIDLGWWGHGRALPRALRALGAPPNQVALVFLTHSHRDHVAGWRAVRGARFHVAAPEYARLVGRDRPRGWIPRWAERVRPSRLPRAGELDVRTFAADTAFVLGADTLRAYVVPGHTAGSAAYLFRGVLFVGDAATYSWWRGFAPARRGYSDDARGAAASLARLWPRLPPGGVRYVCTAHARCAPFTARFLADVAR